MRVRSGDGICEDEAAAAHTIRFQDCVSPESIACRGIEVEGPPDSGPGEYLFTAAASVPVGANALYFFQVENLDTRQRGIAGPGSLDRARAQLTAGTWEIRVAVGTDRDCPFVACAPVRVVVRQDVGPFVRADCNADQRINVADAICFLDWLLLDGARPGCLAVANVNGDSSIDTSDAIYLLLRLTGGGPDPVAPFPTCGVSATRGDQMLGCETPPSYCQ